jgi:hypothetical protein
MNDLQPTRCKSVKGFGALIVGFEFSGEGHPHEFNLHEAAADNERSESDLPRECRESDRTPILKRQLVVALASPPRVSPTPSTEQKKHH